MQWSRGGHFIVERGAETRGGACNDDWGTSACATVDHHESEGSILAINREMSLSNRDSSTPPLPICFLTGSLFFLTFFHK